MFSFYKKIFFYSGCFLITFCCTGFASATPDSYVITTDEYCTFLQCNAAADPHGLYDVKMESLIKRHGSPGAYRYKILQEIKDFENYFGKLPMPYMSRISQARFCNWKENTKNGEQSNNTETGVYDLTKIEDEVNGDVFAFKASSNSTYTLSDDNNGAGIPDQMLGMFQLFSLKCSEEDNASADKNSFTTTSEKKRYENSTSVNKGLGATSSLSENLGADNPQLLGLPSPLGSSQDLETTQNITPLSIDLVTIDDPGNANDGVQYGMLGSVTNVFQIGKYDVTAAQYCAFLNAVATKNDIYELYDPRMGSDTAVACITRKGTNNSYIYEVIENRQDFPITYVSILEVSRFCNWMENGQPIGVEGAGVTETGSFDISVTMASKTNYTTNMFGQKEPHVTPYIASTTITPMRHALWSYPTEDQFYKSAYYQKAKVGLDGFSDNSQIYYTYGTTSDYIPKNDIAGADSSPNSANFCLNGSYTKSGPPYITPVGTFNKTTSPFGCYDMSGNVDQWVACNDYYTTFSVRGGSWKSTNPALSTNGALEINTGDIGVSSMRRSVDPSVKTNTIGFRLVYNAPSPPESWAQFLEGIPVRLGVRFWECVVASLPGFSWSNMTQDLVNASMSLYPWVWSLIYPEALKLLALKSINQFRNVPTRAKLKGLEEVLNYRRTEGQGLKYALEGAKAKTEAVSEELERLFKLREKDWLLGQLSEVEFKSKILLNGTTVRGAGEEKIFNEELERSLIRQAERLRAARAEQGIIFEDLGISETQTVAAVLELTEAEEALAASALLPPPLDVLVPVGITVAGLFLAYNQTSVDGAKGGFGVTLDGLGLWNVLKAFFSYR